MKLFTSITALVAAASARQVFDHEPAENYATEKYANSAEIYQSALEQQQQGLYNGQSQAYSGHGSAHQSRPSAEKVARILSYTSENNGHEYQYLYETENGIKAQEVGQTSEHGTVANGAYSYTGDDGQVYTVQYTADEHGFRAQGPHLPTPPPIPHEILKALEQNAKDEAAGIYDDGNYRHQAHRAHQQSQQQYDPSYQNAGYHQQELVSSSDLAYRGHH